MLLRKILPFLILFPVGMVLGQNTEQESVPPDAPVEIYYGKPFVRSYEGAIADLKVTIFPEDVVRFFPDPRFGLGGKISITRATPVVLNDGGKESVVRTFKKTVGELMEEKGLVLGAQDTIDPGVEAAFAADSKISITRVEETDVVEKHAISFKTVTQSDADVYACSSVVAQEGKNGTKEVTYHVRRENGVEVSRKLLSENVTAEPVEKIIKNGTKTPPVYESGLATWYAWRAGQAAHKTLAFGTKVLVRSTNGKTTCVTITDRGPWDPARVIDLDRSNFQALAPLGAGVIGVTLYVIP